MYSENKIKLEIITIKENEKKIIDGISFSSICYIDIIIDGVRLLEDDFYSGSFIILSEIKKSSIKSGKFLIFTSVSGIADDAGWNYIDVIHENGIIKWEFERDNYEIVYTFLKKNYLEEIEKVESELDMIGSNFILEPVNIIYPE